MRVSISSAYSIAKICLFLVVKAVRDGILRVSEIVCEIMLSFFLGHSNR